MTKAELSKLADGLVSLTNNNNNNNNNNIPYIDHFEALEETIGYDAGRTIPLKVYKKGLQQIMLAQWLSHQHSVYVLTGSEYNIDAAQVGREWAAFLRVRNPDDGIVLRVYPKDKDSNGSTATATDTVATIGEYVILQLLVSLIYNLATLVPDEFERGEDLCKRNFEELARGGPNGIGAGLRILEAFPRLHRPGKRLLCIVDGLDLAENEGTLSILRQLVETLREIFLRNNGHLIYTVARRNRRLI